MSWQEITRPAVKPSKAPAAVKVGVRAPSRRYQQTVFLMIRPDLISDAPAFLQPGRTVSLLRGSGEHAGMVRLVPGVSWELGRGAGRQCHGRVQLQFAPEVGVPLQKLSARPVEFDYGDDWMEITLPAFTSVSPPPTPAAPVTPRAAPYVGVTARVPDPATILQKRAGGRVR